MEQRLLYINYYPCPPGFQTEWRQFGFHYLLYTHEGRGCFEIGGAQYPARKGDIFYCPPCTKNRISADKEEPFLLSGIDFTVPSGALPLPIAARLSLLGRPFAVDCIREAVGEYKRQGGGSAVADCLLLVLLKNLERQSAADGDGGGASAALLDYIQANCLRPLTHRELSALFSYHKSSINRILRIQTGLSLKAYLISLRIQKAAELLEFSDLPVARVAELCGYGSASYFSEQFRQNTGWAPAAFRRRRQGTAPPERRALDIGSSTVAK